MAQTLPHRWASAVVRRAGWIVAAWICAAVLLRIVAPTWNEVAFDGDFEYLPAEMTSVAGGNLLDEAFPGDRSRSQIVLVLARDSNLEDKLIPSDSIVGLDLLRRIYHRLGEVCWLRATELGYQSGPIETAGDASRWLRLAEESFNVSIQADNAFYEGIADSIPNVEPSLVEPRMAIAFWDRAQLLRTIGGSPEKIESDLEAAKILFPEIDQQADQIVERELDAWRSLMDVLAWTDPVIGSRMRSKDSRLVIMQLSSELAATENIATVEAVRSLIDDVLQYSDRFTSPGLKLELTGSAAVGGETLLAARDAIRYTEWITVIMILAILAYVYRAPLLIIVPMLSIGIAVIVSVSVVTLLTGWSIRQVVPGLDLRVFTTSRIFIVVILFGAGTDYCLFLIARLREEAEQSPWPAAVRKALSSVSGALFGSAMTTVVGLGMLWIASFGKFHNTGPIIAICLLIGLFVCTTFTPALLKLLGPAAFWPSQISTSQSPRVSLLGEVKSERQTSWLWSTIAISLTRHPFTALTLGLVILVTPAIYGFSKESSVTYDLSGQLSADAGSRIGLRLLSQHFDIGEINPVTILIKRPQPIDREEHEKQTKELADQLYDLDDVIAVRTADDPLGDFSPDQEMGLLNSEAWKRRALRGHRLSERYFFSSVPEFKNHLARIDVIMEGDPFAVETAQSVSLVEAFLKDATEDKTNELYQSKVLLTGTTPSIIDLREVTLRDNQRIKIAVVVAVFLILLLVIRRLVLCVYLIITVLISYYATLGLTVLFFKSVYGSDFVGLNWKLPLFLFVILVAVGQDYNVYLVTRVIEEERKLGSVAALRRAVSRTGSIITACGLVMAATFFSMTASAWLPPILELFGWETSHSQASLRGIVELGFALGLGVLIDTFYVRTILVPSFIAAVGRWRKRTRPI